MTANLLQILSELLQKQQEYIDDQHRTIKVLTELLGQYMTQEEIEKATNKLPIK